MHGRPTVRVAKNKPATAAHEVAIALNLSLPLALFQKPDLAAQITIPPEKVPFVITPEISDNIAEHIRAQTGMEVRIVIATETET